MVSIKKILQFLFVFFFLGTGLAVVLYVPYLKAYYHYITSRKDNPTVTIPQNSVVGLRNTIVAQDDKFGIVIPKLGINASVVANVNPFSDFDYNEAFKKGIAHAKGSALPGNGGNIVLFANSPGSFFDVQKYNVYYYLINNLTEGDPIYIYYKSMQYKYAVARKEVLDVVDVNFMDLNTEPKYETLYLMTLWPPGTSFLRYVVEADRQKL